MNSIPIGTCEYGMYDFSDTANSLLLSQGWSAVTFAELSGDYHDDFISYFNSNGGLTALLSWETGAGCCFSFGELTDGQLAVSHPTVDLNCMIWPGDSAGEQCNEPGGHIQGTTYNWYSYYACHNGETIVSQIDPNITFAVTPVCVSVGYRSPGIWKRCGNFTTVNTTESTDEPLPTTTIATAGKSNF